MPAETHQHREDVGPGDVLDVLVATLGLDGDDAAGASLAELGLDDDLALFELWEGVVEEMGERSVGDLAVDDIDPVTLGDLAAAFHRELTRR